MEKLNDVYENDHDDDSSSGIEKAVDLEAFRRLAKEATSGVLPSLSLDGTGDARSASVPIETSSKGADRTIQLPKEPAQPVVEKPVADVVADTQKAQALAAAEALKQQEVARAADYAEQHAKGSPLDRSILTIGALPADVSVAAKPGSLKLAASDFARIAEAVPGVTLDPPVRALLGSLKSASLDGRTVQTEVNAKLPINVGIGTAELTLKNPSFDIMVDPANSNSIILSNIKGMSISMLGLGGDIKRVSMTICTDEAGKKSLRIEIPKPEQAPAKPDDLLARFKSTVSGTVGALALPEKTTINVPLDDPQGAEVVERVFKNVGQWAAAPDKVNPADFAAGVVGVDLKTAVNGILDGITSVSKKGDVLEIARKQATTHELGGLPIEISQLVKAKLETTGDGQAKGLKLSQIDGVSMKMPLPDQIAKALGLGNPIKANLKEVNVGEPDKDGNRILTVKTDSLLESVQIKVGADLKPVPADNKGNIAVDISIKHGDVSLPVSVTFNPQQLEKPPANGPDFTIAIKGGDANYLKLVETIAGTSLESPLKDLVSGVTSISKQGDRISISRDKNTSQDMGGVILEAGRTIQFKATPDGANGVRVTDISGIQIKLPVELPQLVKDLGIDPGKHIHTSLKSLTLSSADAQGRRKLLFETDHLLRQVGVLLGPDMKPALDPKGNWYMYGLVDNPVANQKLPLALRFDKNNQLAMPTQELMRIGSLAAWQAKDNGGLEGAGFGIIAVATEAGAIALDVKDAVVDAAVVVKDKVVEGAVIVKDKVVEGAVIVKDFAVDTTVAVGNKIADGASTVGGWVKSGWNSIFGD